MRKVIFIIVFCLLINNSLFAENHKPSLIESLKTLQQVFNKIKRYHISNPDYNDLVVAAIRGMIKILDDPYTIYFPPKKKDRFKDSIKKHFGGLGIAMGTQNVGNDTYLKIVKVLNVKNCPAKKAGIKDGDVIVNIDSENVKNITFEEAKKKLRGPLNSKITLGIWRLPDTTIINIPVIRGNIELPQVASKLINDTELKIGYIRILSFSELAGKECKEQLQDLMDSGANCFILDLRSNPGGLLNVAVQVVNLFIEKNKLVVFTKNKNEVITKKYFTENEILTKAPLILLVNEYSASASEIVTGALKDYKRAIVVGKKTFGKGSVQQLFDLQNKGGIKLTIAKYYTPSGVCIHKIGIDPDIKIENVKEQFSFAKKLLKSYYIFNKKEQ